MNGKDIIWSLKNVSDSLVEEAEYGEFPIRADNTANKKRTHRLFSRPFLVAAIITLMLFLMGCTYIVLSEADWFKSFFCDRMGQNLSENQAIFIDNNIQKLGQSVTVDGYTMTVESAIADSRNAYIKLILQSPPGTVLDADIYWFEPRKETDGEGYEETFTKLDGPGEGYGAGTWQGIDDGNPNDNSFTIMYALSQTINAELPSFEEGVTYRLHITDLEGYYEDDNRSVLLTENGVWDFDIVFDSINDDSVELITAPIATKYNEFAVEVTSFELQTMSAHATYTGRNDEKGIMCFIDSAVVLKDGTRVEFRPNTFGPSGEASFILTCPIVLDEVDYVELRDGTKIYKS